MAESTVVYLAKRVFELENENMLLRAKIADYPLAETDQKERMKSFYRNRQIGLIRAKLKFEDELKEAAVMKSQVKTPSAEKTTSAAPEEVKTGPNNDVTCDCVCCDETDEGFCDEKDDCL